MWPDRDELLLKQFVEQLKLRSEGDDSGGGMSDWF